MNEMNNTVGNSANGLEEETTMNKMNNASNFVNPEEEYKMNKFIVRTIVFVVVFVAVVIAAFLLNAVVHEVAFFREGVATVTALGLLVVGLLKLQK